MTAQNRVKENFQSKKGFTLIELMVAITIVAILGTIGMVMFSSAQATARDAKRRGDLEDIKKAMYLLKTNKGGWCALYTCPPWQSYANTAGTGMTGVMKTAFIDSGYLKAALHDPQCPAGTCATGVTDYVLQVVSDDKFKITTKLENPPSPGMVIGCVPNDIDDNHNYCVGP